MAVVMLRQYGRFAYEQSTTKCSNGFDEYSCWSLQLGTPDCNIAATVFYWMTLLSQAPYVREWFTPLNALCVNED